MWRLGPQWFLSELSPDSTEELASSDDERMLVRFLKRAFAAQKGVVSWESINIDQMVQEWDHADGLLRSEVSGICLELKEEFCDTVLARLSTETII